MRMLHDDAEGEDDLGSDIFGPGAAPAKLQCWPRAPEGDLAPCPAGPEAPTTVLEDVQDAWEGACTRLQRVELQGDQGCEANCSTNVSCPGWQEVRVAGGTECWQGLGHRCEVRRLGFSPLGGQRLMHGHYRVLRDLKGVHVLNLQNVFGRMMSPREVGPAIATCRKYCLSLLACEVWQYSSITGCWVEDPSVQSIDYPPSDASFVTNSLAAQRIVAGEYVQRLCAGVGTSSDSQSALVPIRIALSAGSGSTPSVGTRLLALVASASWRGGIIGFALLAFPLVTLVCVIRSRRKLLDRKRGFRGKPRPRGESEGKDAEEDEDEEGQASESSSEEGPDAPLIANGVVTGVGQLRHSAGAPRLPHVVLPALLPEELQPWDNQQGAIAAAALGSQKHLPPSRSPPLETRLVTTKALRLAPQFGPRPAERTIESPVPMLLNPALAKLEAGASRVSPQEPDV
jgi:hypothetical protein